MEKVSEILKNNRTDDITWFCSLSESEMDFIISLKNLVKQRATTSGHEELAEKFDLKMLRALGLVLMKDVSEKVQDDTSLSPSVVHQLSLLDDFNLLKSNVEDSIDIEEILTELFKKNLKRKSRKWLVTSLNTL